MSRGSLNLDSNHFDALRIGNTQTEFLRQTQEASSLNDRRQVVLLSLGFKHVQQDRINSDWVRADEDRSQGCNGVAWPTRSTVVPTQQGVSDDQIIGARHGVTELSGVTA